MVGSMGYSTKGRWTSPKQTLLPKQNGAEQVEERVTECEIISDPAWPDGPRSLSSDAWEWIGDMVIVIVPFYFIFLGAAAISLHQKPTNDPFGPKVEFAIRLGPTVWPIMFAAICGNSMKMIARYLGERGAKLGTLELLVGSRSTFATVQTQALLRKVTAVGVSLLLLWALSPLGGQASLRLLRTGQSFQTTSQSLRYMSTGPAALLLAMSSTFGGEEYEAQALYTTAVLAPNDIKTRTQDTWGNVKIPHLGSLDLSKANSEGWVEPHNSTTVEDYVALAGIPVAGRPTSGLVDFPLEVSYLDLECSKSKQAGPLKDLNELEAAVPGVVWRNLSSTGQDPFSTDGANSFFLQTTEPLFPYGTVDDGFLGRVPLAARMNAFSGLKNDLDLDKLRTTPEYAAPRTITLASKFQIGFNTNEIYLNVINCTLTQQHVDVRVKCEGDHCRVRQIRKSVTDTRPSEFTGLEHTQVARGFLTSLPTSMRTTRGSSRTEQFLFDTMGFNSDPAVHSTTTRQRTNVVDLSVVPPAVLSRRLSIIFNTYYQFCIGSRAYFVTSPQNASTVGPDTLPVNDIDKYVSSNSTASNTTFENLFRSFGDVNGVDGLLYVGATTNATVTETEDIYLCDFLWLGVLYVSTVVILLTGLTSLFLKWKSLGPDLFGYVTSMTYNNSYTKIPPGGSGLDAIERARLLRDVRVHMGDVCGDRDVGHIALASGVPIRKLEKGRKYI